MLDTTTMTALGGGAGIALLLRELISVVAALRNGVSAREGKRKADIVQQRDEALERATKAEAQTRAANARADLEREKRIAYQEDAAAHRRQLVENGLTPGSPPDIETTHA